MKKDKKDKGDKILQRADRQAQRVAKKVEAAGRRAEKTKQKQAAQAQKKAARAAKQATKKAAKTTNRADKAAKKAQLIAKKAEDKKAKAVAKAAAKAEDLPQEGEEGAGKKKKNKKKLLMIAAPVLAVAIGAGAFFFLKGGGGEEEEEGPPPPIPIPGMYEIEGAVVSALPAWGENVLVYMEEILPEKEEGEEAEADAEDDEAEESFVPKLYRYEGLQAPGKLVAAYTTLMISDDAGFSTVDNTLLRIDPPEFTGEESRGSVQLARNVPATEETEAGVQSLLLAWEGDSCTVSVEAPEGRVHDPQPETTAGMGIVRRSLSDIKAMQPSILGLPGVSMEEYDLLPQDGSVRIGGEPCQRINVYDHDSQIAGSYFLSSGGKLYKLDEATNGVVQLEWE